MLHRFRAHIRFTSASGLATWCRDQMHVRWLQAVHINEGAANAEPPRNDVIDGETEQVFVCDVALSDQAAVDDAVATLSDPNVLGLSLPLSNRPSWVESHVCDHDESVRAGCAVTALEEGPS